MIMLTALSFGTPRTITYTRERESGLGPRQGLSSLGHVRVYLSKRMGKYLQSYLLILISLSSEFLDVVEQRYIIRREERQWLF